MPSIFLCRRRTISSTNTIAYCSITAYGMITIAAHWRASPLLRTARHRWCRQRIFPLLAVIKPNNAWFAGRAQAKGKAEVLKRFAPVARSVSWNVTAVAGNAWRILTSRTDSQNKATLSVAGGLAQRVCDFLDTHFINYQTCRARAIGASSPQMGFPCEGELLFFSEPPSGLNFPTGEGGDVTTITTRLWV